MARLTPDPEWLAQFEAIYPGDPKNEDAALGIAYLKSLWPGGDVEALEHLDRVFEASIYEMRQTTLERALTDEAIGIEDVRRLAREIDQLRAGRMDPAA